MWKADFIYYLSQKRILDAHKSCYVIKKYYIVRNITLLQKYCKYSTSLAIIPDTSWYCERFGRVLETPKYLPHIMDVTIALALALYMIQKRRCFPCYSLFCLQKRKSEFVNICESSLTCPAEPSNTLRQTKIWLQP